MEWDFFSSNFLYYFVILLAVILPIDTLAISPRMIQKWWGNYDVRNYVCMCDVEFLKKLLLTFSSIILWHVLENYGGGIYCFDGSWGFNDLLMGYMEVDLSDKLKKFIQNSA